MSDLLSSITEQIRRIDRPLLSIIKDYLRDCPSDRSSLSSLASHLNQHCRGFISPYQGQSGWLRKFIERNSDHLKLYHSNRGNGQLDVALVSDDQSDQEPSEEDQEEEWEIINNSNQQQQSNHQSQQNAQSQLTTVIANIVGDQRNVTESRLIQILRQQHRTVLQRAGFDIGGRIAWREIQKYLPSNVAVNAHGDSSTMLSIREPSRSQRPAVTRSQPAPQQQQSQPARQTAQPSNRDEAKSATAGQPSAPKSPVTIFYNGEESHVATCYRIVIEIEANRAQDRMRWDRWAVRNDSNRVLTLRSITATVNTTSLELALNSSPVSISPGEQIPLSLLVKRVQPLITASDVIDSVLKFDFGSSCTVFRGIILSYIQTGYRIVQDGLQPSAPYRDTRRNRTRNRNRQTVNYLEGNRPERDTLKYINTIKKYEVDGHLKSISGALHRATSEGNIQSAANLPAILKGPLTIKNYVNRFDHLLWFDELAQEEHMEMYSTRAGLTKFPNRQLRLHVPGLAESRPSLAVGDEVQLCPRPFDELDQLPKEQRIVYRGYIHHVRELDIDIDFNARFYDSYVNGTPMYIRFTYNRSVTRRMHRAIELIGKHSRFGSILFPSLQSSNSNQNVSDDQYAYIRSVVVTSTNQRSEADVWVANHMRGVTDVGVDVELHAHTREFQLIQISSGTHCLLYHIGSSGSAYLPPGIVNLLTNPSIRKFLTGMDDIETLRRHVSVSVDAAQFHDVQQMAQRWKPDEYRQRPGLKTLAEALIGWDLPKPMQIRVSAWSWPLSAAHRDYAASDALATLRVGVELRHRLDELNQQRHEAKMPPSQSSAAATSTPEIKHPFRDPLPPNSRNLGNLNFEQQLAVESILKGTHGSHPYIIFGPAGTGKTKTVVESICQLVKANPKVKILAVAPSNAAADLLCTRIAPRLGGSPYVKRVHALSRSVQDVKDREILAISHHNGTFFIPPTKENNYLLNAQVVISTCCSASLLYSFGLESQLNFTHIFCDECGHAQEPEFLMSVGGLMGDKTAVILAGDALQLGPLILSPAAAQLGLRMSLLERLLQRGYQNIDLPAGTAVAQPNPWPYAERSSSQSLAPANSLAECRQLNPYNPDYVTCLRRNYRSHPDILAPSHSLFYQYRLISCAASAITDNLLTHPIFESNRFPIRFLGVNGEEKREESSPSWFNIQECAEVVRFVDSLLRQGRHCGVEANHIGILTPYRQQAKKIAIALQLKCIPGRESITIGSAEVFQGQERRIMIISTVRSQWISYERFDRPFSLGFVKQPKRINVALTRAQSGLIVIGNPNVLMLDPHWAAFIQYVKGKGGFGPSNWTWSTAEQQRDAIRRAEQEARDAMQNDEEGDEAGGYYVEGSPDPTR